MTNTPAGDEVKKLAGPVPLGRSAQPEEIANVVAFLLSPEASYMTGTVIPIDGGLVA